jgi:hypothetical protein
MTEVHPTFAECSEALDRISRTSDGATLYVLLQRSMMSFPLDSSDGALRSNHGERSFAAKLIGLMAKGIAESGGRTGSTSGGGTSDGEQPIVVPSPEPRRVGRIGNPGGRRITPDTRVPGYDPDEA